MRIVIISILLIISSVCIAKNDTIYLYDNYIERNGLKYNQVVNKIKTGKWIEFIVDDNTFILRLGSGENAHWHDKIFTEYRPLKKGEYYGIEKMSFEEVVDTINGDVIYSGSYKKIKNKIPPDKYYISGEGNYNNNDKEGKWVYLYKNGKLNKKIHYTKGLPKKGFKIFRPDGSKMFKLIRTNDEDWEIIKYSETGNLIDREIKKIEEIEPLY